MGCECGACQVLRRKCTSACIFAPYFPADQAGKFDCMRQVYGATNISKILGKMKPEHREEAVNSFVSEAQFRLQDPIHGCVGIISVLQQKLKQVMEVVRAKGELSPYEQRNNTPQHPQQMLKAQNSMNADGPLNLGSGLQDDPFCAMQFKLQMQLLSQRQRSGTNEGPRIGPNGEYLFIKPSNNMPRNSQVSKVLNNQMMSDVAVDLGLGSYQVPNTQLETEGQLLIQGKRSGSDMPHHPQQMLDPQDQQQVPRQVVNNHQVQDDHFCHMPHQTQEQLLIQPRRSGSDESSSIGQNREYKFIKPSSNMPHHPQHMLEGQDIMKMACEQQQKQRQRPGSDEGPSTGPTSSIREYQFMPKNNMMGIAYEQQQQIQRQESDNQMMRAWAMNLRLGNYENDSNQTRGIQRQRSGKKEGPSNGPSS